MTPEEAQALRAPFPAAVVDKLPKVWCRACRDAQGKVCQQHAKVKCRECGNSITGAHLHVEYVGHAEVTDRLLAVDPAWTWEPLAFGEDGLPLLDRNGGLWMRLTVAGVTRLGYGHADGKNGPDAVKEAIGDGLRNAALRFGVALDMWRRKEHRAEPGEQPPSDARTAPAPAELRTEIARVGRERGMDPAAIAEDFQAWSEGTRIGVTEDPRLLGDYLKRLRTAA